MRKNLICTFLGLIIIAVAALNADAQMMGGMGGPGKGMMMEGMGPGEMGMMPGMKAAVPGGKVVSPPVSAKAPGGKVKPALPMPKATPRTKQSDTPQNSRKSFFQGNPRRFDIFILFRRAFSFG